MKRILTLMAFMLGSLSIFAQESTITGRVTNAKDNSPAIGVSVSVKGTKNATLTDAEGKFSINAPANGILVLTSVGFATKEVSIEGKTNLEITISEATVELEGVVVTALGQQRQKRSLGYATQQISGSDLQVARENNIVSNLSGRVAGVVINRVSSGPGSSTRISLRGERSLRGNNQPLIVIDGVPVDNTQKGGTGEFNGNDGGDAIGNLNPDDIESMNILRGPNASALYGARASNGVLVITTKKGRAQKGIGLTYTNNTSWETAIAKVKMQDIYAQGNGTYSATDENSWGPRITGQSITNWQGQTYSAEAQNHVNELLQTGFNTTNNVSFTAGNDKSQVRFSYNNLYSKGIIPNNTQNRNSFILRSTSDFGNLNVDVKLNYINQLIKNRPQGGEEAQNPYSSALRMPTTVRNSDLKNYINTSGAVPVNNFFSPNSAIIGNPYWMVNKLEPREERNRFIGATTLRYKIQNNFNITGRIGIDRYNDDNTRKVYAGTPTPFAANSSSGNFSFERYFAEEINMELFATYDATLTKDLKLSALVGTALRKNRSEVTLGNAGGLDIPDLFTTSNGRSLTSDYDRFEQEIQSAFASAQFNWKDKLFLDITGRNDWASTLPSSNRSFFYPSFSLSGIISEMVKLPDWWSYAKLRTSYAFVGKEATPYQLAQTLIASQGVNGTILRNRSELVNPDLKPEQTRAFEIGAELRFLNNRLSLDFTYYNTNTINQVISLPLPVSSGFNTKLVNAGKISNKGIEILLSGNPIRTRDFRWDVGINFTRYRTNVVELDPQLKTFTLGSTRVADVVANEGERFGNMYVNGFLKDADGLIQINATTGLPSRTQRNVLVGNVFPDWTGGINNTITYKNWSVDFLIDARIGGVVASHTNAVLAGLGKLPETVVGRDGNNFIATGVLAGTKTPNNVQINPRSYWQLVGGRGNPIGEQWIYKADNIRLRQFSINYRFPAKMFTNSFIQGVNVSLYGRNLFFLKKDAPFDPEVSLNTGLGGQGIDFWGLPTTRTIGFNVNVNF